MTLRASRAPGRDPDGLHALTARIHAVSCWPGRPGGGENRPREQCRGRCRRHATHVGSAGEGGSWRWSPAARRRSPGCTAFGPGGARIYGSSVCA